MFLGTSPPPDPQLIAWRFFFLENLAKSYVGAPSKVRRPLLLILDPLQHSAIHKAKGYILLPLASRKSSETIPQFMARGIFSIPQELYQSKPCVNPLALRIALLSWNFPQQNPGSTPAPPSAEFWIPSSRSTDGHDLICV